MTPASPSPVTPPPVAGAPQNAPLHFLVRWLIPIAALIISVSLVWSNHFVVSFHGDDADIVVNNHALSSLKNIPRFFTQPTTSSADGESADYRPLLTASYAVDARLSGANGPLTYQMQSFLWFALLLLWLYILFRLIPGTNEYVALFGTAFFAMQPVAADTVNYISRRGHIMGAAGVTMALALWILWPRRLPQRLGIDLARVPQSWWQSQLRQNGLAWERMYKRFLRLPLPFYLIPMVPALLADPAAAVYPLLLLCYIRLYETEKKYSALVVPGTICGAYWLLQSFVAWHSSPLFRVPVLQWWATEPLVALRYFVAVLFPFHLSADSGMVPLNGTQPAALGGWLGLIGLVVGAVATSRSARWRGVSFGLWWFLISLAPVLLAPQRTVESHARLFFAGAGLAFAVAHLGEMVFNLIESRGWGESLRLTALGALAAAGLTILAVSGWLTFDRNRVWESEKTLWHDVMEKSPSNPKGYIEYAAALLQDSYDAEAVQVAHQAAELSPKDPLLQLRLAQTFDRLNQDTDTERHFRRTIELAPAYARAFAQFGRWCFLHQRLREAFEYSSKALSLNSSSLVARHTLIDIYSAKSDWPMVEQLAKQALQLDPTDPDATRSLVLATSSMDRLSRAESEVKNAPTVDEYLRLSVLYYHDQRYEDSVKAAQGALRLRPDLAEAYANMATALHTLGRDDEAIAALREVIRLRPDMAFAKSDMDLLLESQGRKKNAKQK